MHKITKESNYRDIRHGEKRANNSMKKKSVVKKAPPPKIKKK